ncbi:MAG: SpoIID/LytB domain-containing protein [Clostridia bacterium]|nr:SpoIID/LytB domain-containing protein [Clostridia bacterium]
MVNKKTQKDRTSRQKEPRSKIFVRIFSIFLAALLLLGSLFYTIYFLIPRSAALDYTAAGENPLMAIGICYGSDAEVSWDLSSDHGFWVGRTVIEDDTRGFYPLWQIGETSCTALIADNVYYSDGYSKTGSGGYAFGRFHVQIGEACASREEAAERISAAIPLAGVFKVYPAYIDNSYRVFLSDFSTAERAQNVLASLPDLTSAYSCSVYECGSYSVSLVDHAQNQEIFVYDCGVESSLGVKPISADGSVAYTRANGGRLYPDCLAFRRYQEGSVDGVEMINLLPLETYIAGVIPWEISNAWPYQMLRTMAIAARTFAASHLRRHFSSWKIDVCATDNCQYYGGFSKTNEAVWKAVNSTRGMILTYQGSPVLMSFCSSHGGQSLGSEYAYVTALDYLPTALTPWEKYAQDDHWNGVWYYDVSPALYWDRMYYRRGYTQLSSGEIADVTVNSYVPGTEAVYSATVTDTDGNSVTFTGTSNTMVGVYWPDSPIWVVGRGSVTLTYETPLRFAYTTDGSEPVFSEEPTETEETNLYDLTYSSVRIKVETKTETMTITGSSPDNFVFAGKGFGHSVGLSQYGGYDLAEYGLTAEEILDVYFPGTEIYSPIERYRTFDLPVAFPAEGEAPSVALIRDLPDNFVLDEIAWTDQNGNPFSVFESGSVYRLCAKLHLSDLSEGVLADAFAPTVAGAPASYTEEYTADYFPTGVFTMTADIEVKPKLVLAFSVRAFSWEQEGTLTAALYPADRPREEILADLAGGGALKIPCESSVEDPAAAADRYAQTVSFYNLADGTYRLALTKTGKYLPILRDVVISSADAPLAFEETMVLYGDVTMDGHVNSQDALQLVRFFNGKASVFGSLQDERLEAFRLQAADVTGDGCADSRDALQIVRYSSGRSSLFDLFA